MKILFYGLILTALTFTACHVQTEDIKQTEKDAAVTFSFTCPDPYQVDMNTRTLNSSQEKQLSDLNIYMYNKAEGLMKHQYITGNVSTIRLIHGQWDVYAVANRGYDLGELTEFQVENLKYTISEEKDLEKNSELPMAAFQSITVRKNTTVQIVLKRIVARIDVSVNVQNDIARNITINSISLVNIPDSGCFFKSDDLNSGMIRYPLRIIENNQTASFYMFENLRGVNNTISDQRYKCSENAPADASYLLITGKTKDERLNYKIYLGENNTTDFNVRANCNYKLDINIRGINEADYRVEVVYIPKYIDLTITQADISTITYYPNLTMIGSDNTLEMMVKLSEPSKWDIKVPITGAWLYDEVHTLTPDTNFFHDPVIRIPAGTTSIYKKFYLELRDGWDGIVSLFYNECTVLNVISAPDDKNVYTYKSGYFPVRTVKSEMVGYYPPIH